MQNLTFSEILWILGAITAVCTFVGFISRPYKMLQDKLTEQEKTISEVSDEIKVQQKLLNSSLKVQLLLMQHIVYGNHTELLKTELDKFQETIVDTK